jgi:hypothetical protein
VFDLVTARIVRAGYAAVSLLTGDPRPVTFMDTYLAGRQARDGLFVLTRPQVDRIIARSDALHSAIALEKKLLEHALERALSGQTDRGVEPAIAAWSLDVVARLRQQSSRTGTVATEDITTADYAQIVNRVRERGRVVQLSPGQHVATFISFGNIRYHFEGRLSFEPVSASQPDSLLLEAATVLVDEFDFHSAQEDPGTGWMDHALARLQRSGDAKPFRIEGTGSPFKLAISKRLSV